MPTITALLPTPKRPGRFALQVDGKADATLSLEAIERLGLGVGSIIDETAEAAVRREAALLATYDRALDLLALRARSAVELRRMLLRKQEPRDLVETAIERLLRAGFLDDASFARQFARSRALGAGLSRRRLQQELALRGVARDVASAALNEVFTEEPIDEVAGLERVARKKLALLAKLDAPTRRRRLSAFLVRRGYDFDDVNRIVDTLVGREAEPVPAREPKRAAPRGKRKREVKGAKPGPAAESTASTT
jgi:regulatory protein